MFNVTKLNLLLINNNLRAPLFMNNIKNTYQCLRCLNRACHKSDVFATFNEAIKLKDKSTSSSIIDKSVDALCLEYDGFTLSDKSAFLTKLACEYAVDHDNVLALSKSLASNVYNESQSLKIQDKLKGALTPQYHWLFVQIGRRKRGVKFLVDLRTDLLNLLQNVTMSNDTTIHLQQLNNALKNLLMLWFSVGFLHLERITWKSSCEMLQKISEYEAVHPIRNWTDLKVRVGPDRRCFVYTHRSMPGEPLVVLHTVLREQILSNVSGLIQLNGNVPEIPPLNIDKVKAVTFYSITSTQKGLTGIELGNYIIKRVANELTREFPKLEQFSSLSPIPKFKSWLFDKLKAAENNKSAASEVFYGTEFADLSNVLGADVFRELKRQLNGNGWLQTPGLADVLRPLLLRMCVRYLYVEKKRGYALDSVANFHLRNGAQLWRINWMADMTARGLTQSCGMMVNYRYFLEETDRNSELYIRDKEIFISDMVTGMLTENKLL